MSVTKEKSIVILILTVLVLICFSCNDSSCKNSINYKERSFDLPKAFTENEYDCINSDSVFFRFTSGFDSTHFILKYESIVKVDKFLNTDIYSQAGRTSIHKEDIDLSTMYFNNECIDLKVLRIPSKRCRVLVEVDSGTLIFSYGNAYPYIL